MKAIWIRRSFLGNLRKVVRETDFSKGERVAVKVHFGEYGNLTHVRPQIVNAVVEELLRKGVRPFLFDTPTLYPGSRDTPKKYLETARRHGFTEETMGCPIVISDEGVEVKGKKYLDVVEVAKPICEADGLFVLSHFKGHPDAGFGGCIKNIGMGCVTKETKRKMHEGPRPRIIGECSGCGECVEVCKTGAISLRGGKVHIDYSRCFGCCACVEACPNGILESSGSLRTLLSEVAAVVLERFEKAFFVNVLFDITERCDCFPIGGLDAGRIICPNLGMIASRNVVVADKAALDLVRKTVGDVFRKTNFVDPDEQIRSAVEFGLGPEDYELEVLD